MSGASDVITAIAGGGGALAACGGAIKFVWDKIETRFLAIEDELARCHEREIASQRRETASQERRAVLTTVIELLWQEVKRIDPNAPILARAQHLMNELKSMSGTPPE